MKKEKNIDSLLSNFEGLDPSRWQKFNFNTSDTYLLLLGEAKPPLRILKGSNARLGEFPWMVSIQYDELHICGGAIISDRHILTAAHCFVGKYPAPYNQSMTVVSGTINRYSGGETHKVAKVAPHEDFQRGPTTRWRNDIALVTVSSSDFEVLDDVWFCHQILSWKLLGITFVTSFQNLWNLAELRTKSAYQHHQLFTPSMLSYQDLGWSQGDVQVKFQ